jgi:hypothetical protein
MRGSASRLAPLVLAAVLALVIVRSYSVALVVDDGIHNTGDETNSLTLAWTAYETGIPSYGVLADGTPWTLGGLTLPVYYALYGSRVAHVDPADRIHAARSLSRLLAGLSLLLVLLTLITSRASGLVRSGRDAVTLLVSAACICFLFAAHQSFVLVSSFGRVDALGLFSVCLSGAAFARFRRSPMFGSLLRYALTVDFAYFSNNVAFLLVSLMFIVTTTAQLRRDRFGMFGRAVSAAALFGVGADFLLNHVWLTPTVSTSTAYPTSSATIGDLEQRLIGSPRAILLSAWHQSPELVASICVTIAAAVGCLIWVRRATDYDSSRVSVREVALLGVALPPVIGWFGINAAPEMRPVYVPMVLLAATLPYLVVACAGGRAFLAGPLLLLAVLTQLSPSIWSGYSGWGHWGRSVVIAASPTWRKPPAEERTANVLNTVRAEHLRSLDRYLSRHLISPTLTDDPLFTLRNGAVPRYLFLNQKVTTADEEWGVLAESRRKLGVTSLVTDAFGRDSFLHQYGYPRLKQALSREPRRRSVEVRYPEGVILARRVFVSKSPTGKRAGVEYSYFGGVPSTPFTVYLLELRPGSVP